MANVISAPAVVMVSAVSGVPATSIVLTAIEVPAVARVSAVSAAVPTAVDVPFAVGVSKFSGSLML